MLSVGTVVPLFKIRRQKCDINKDIFCLRRSIIVVPTYQNLCVAHGSYKEFKCSFGVYWYSFLVRTGKSRYTPIKCRISSVLLMKLYYILISEEFHGNLTLQYECDCPIPCSKTEYNTRISSAYFPANLYDDWIKATFGYTDIR